MALSPEQFQQLLHHNQEQQHQLIDVLTRGKWGNMTKCKTHFNGEKHTEAVESFLSALCLFKDLEDIEDTELLQGLPLVLNKEAGIWWQGVKDEIKTYTDFAAQLRNQFAPMKPAHIIYQELTTIKQEVTESTEDFITKKKMLFSLLPEPKHPVTQQLDMIYHLLRLEIRDKAPRISVTTYDQLIESARGIEQVLKERKSKSDNRYPSHTTKRVTVVRCDFCKNRGHVFDECRKQLKMEKKSPHPTYNQVQTQAPSPSQPRFSCYGCGTPGVLRTNCPNCSGKNPKVIKEEVGFCVLTAHIEAKPRPVIPAMIGGIKWYPYLDTCAKANVASYLLYRRLLKQRYNFKSEQVDLTLADGITKKSTVLTVQVDVEISERVFRTNFMVLPECKENKTLLGIGFLTEALMVLNLPQFTWYFVDDPDKIYELFTEDVVIFNTRATAKRNEARSSTTPKRTRVAYAPISTTTAQSDDDDQDNVSIPETIGGSSQPHESAETSRGYRLMPVIAGSCKTAQKERTST